MRRDKEAVELVFKHYGKILLGTILRIVKDQAIAEDALQEVLVKVWKNGDRYDQEKGRLFTWLINIARNTAIDKTRTKEFKYQTNIQSGASVVSESRLDQSYELPTDQIGLSDLMNKLDEKYQEVLEIVYFMGYSHRDAAKKLNIPLGTLKTRIRMAIDELKKLTGN